MELMKSKNYVRLTQDGRQSIDIDEGTGESPAIGTFKRDKKRYIKMGVCVTTTLLVITTGVLVFFSLNSGSNGSSMSKDDAIVALADTFTYASTNNAYDTDSDSEVETFQLDAALMTSTSTSTGEKQHIPSGISKAQLATLQKVFSTFDTNDDNSWDFDEYKDFLETSLNIQANFELLDIDSDGSWSFGELVYLLEKSHHFSTSTHFVFSYVMDPLIRYTYGNFTGVYDYSSIDDTSYTYPFPYTMDSISSDRWYQYAASLIMSSYDSNCVGSLTEEEYVLNYAQSSYHNLVVPGQDGIEFNQFMNQSFDSFSLAILSKYGIVNSKSSSNTSNYLTSLSDNFDSYKKDHSSPMIYSCVNIHSHKYTSDSTTSSRRMISSDISGPLAMCIGTSAACVGTTTYSGVSGNMKDAGHVATYAAACTSATAGCTACYKYKSLCETVSEVGYQETSQNIPDAEPGQRWPGPGLDAASDWDITDDASEKLVTKMSTAAKYSTRANSLAYMPEEINMKVGGNIAEDILKLDTKIFSFIL